MIYKDITWRVKNGQKKYGAGFPKTMRLDWVTFLSKTNNRSPNWKSFLFKGSHVYTAENHPD